MRITRNHIIFAVIHFLMLYVLNGQVINAGVAGNTSANVLERIEEDVLEKNPDLVIVMVGTNDMLNSRKLISFDEYEDNLKQIINNVIENNSKILLVSSPPVDSVYLFKRHDKDLFKKTPNVKMDSARHIASRLAQKSKVRFLDLYQVFTDMNLPNHNEDFFFKNIKNSGVADGVHPTALGYRFIGEFVYRFLKENQFTKQNQKIICLGDSITYGSGMIGKGTATGDTYPAVLQNFINKKI